MQKREGRSFAPPSTPPARLDLGRTGRKGTSHTGLPPQVPLPPLASALSRRAALFGAVTVAGVSTVAGVPAAAPAGTLSANDTRLVAITDAYLDLDRRCHEHTTAHRGRHTPESDADFDLMVEGFGPLEEECAAIPADSLAGVVAKTKLCRNPTARGCADYEHIASVVDDLWRLFGTGAVS